MLLDPRLWLLIGIAIGMLFTIEAIEDFAEGAWPHLHRPSRTDGSLTVGQYRALWTTVAMVVLPGLVLAILNLAILVAENLPYSNTQLLGTIFIAAAWLVFLATMIDLGGVGTYLNEVGAVAPMALLLVLLIGDCLLLIALIDIFPRSLHEFIALSRARG